MSTSVTKTGIRRFGPISRATSSLTISRNGEWAPVGERRSESTTPSKKSLISPGNRINASREAPNARDHIGPNLPPDYLTTVREGGFYGWPWYYTGRNQDPAHAGQRPDLQRRVIVPDVLLQPHSSTMQIAFYDKTGFPADYRGDAFATMQGSWNREERTGYKVVCALMKDGKPTGVYEDFMTGFVLDKDTVWGRPTGLAFAADGSLLVSDDANGTIFRVTPQGSR